MALWIAGVDGCKEGWIAALMRLDEPEIRPARVVRHLSDIVDAPEAPGIVAVDMPIGLPEIIDGPGRGPERLVRPLLGKRRSSVFSIPARAAVYAPDYRAACAVALGASNPPRKVSKQSFMIFPRIREIDTLLRARAGLASRVYEAHPEVAFWSMNGETPLAEPKKANGRPHAEGLALRRGLLRAAGLDAGLVAAGPPKGAAADDYLDALACLVVARRIHAGTARPFPDPPGVDAKGLRMAIWV